jgi:predicted regulator of Ras-like GTPase activity (Roadblock/LC7/MglB family)
MLNNVISDLKAKSDIQGAVLINGGGHIIARSLPNTSISHLKLSELLPKLMELSLDNTNKTQHFMFPHLVSEHKGRKIIARYVNEDLFLLVLLQKSCYMGPAMLDLENSILRIQEILGGHIP